MDDTTKSIVTTVLAGQARTYAAVVAGALVGRHILPEAQQGQFTDMLVGIAMGSIAAGYSWWNAVGHAKAQALLKKVTGTHTVEDAKAVATVAPAAPPASPTAIQTAKIIAGMLLLAILLMPADGWAKPKTVVVPEGARDQVKLVAPTGNLRNDIKNAVGAPSGPALRGTLDNTIFKVLLEPFQKLADFVAGDSDDAITLASAIPSLHDGHGQQCWIAMKQFASVINAHPLPVTLRAQTDLEGFRLMSMAAKNLCNDVHCTQVFADLSSGIEQLAPLNVSIPVISMHDICSKIPAVSVIETITPPPLTTTVPAGTTPQIPAPAPNATPPANP